MSTKSGAWFSMTYMYFLSPGLFISSGHWVCEGIQCPLLLHTCCVGWWGLWDWWGWWGWFPFFWILQLVWYTCFSTYIYTVLASKDTTQCTQPHHPPQCKMSSTITVFLNVTMAYWKTCQSTMRKTSGDVILKRSVISFFPGKWNIHNFVFQISTIKRQ